MTTPSAAMPAHDPRYDQEKAKWNRKAGRLAAHTTDWTVRETYDGVFGSISFLKPVYAFFDRLDAPGVHVLDYGCGTGWVTVLLAQKAARVTAVDIAEGQVEIVRRKADATGLTNVEARVADGEALPFENGTFDYVFGGGVLHHIRLERSLPEIARVLKPGGRAAFVEPWALNPVVNAMRYIKHHVLDPEPGTDRPLRRSDLAALTARFRHVEVIPSAFFSSRYRGGGLPVLERFLLRLPGLRWQAAQVTLLLHTPA